MSDASWPDADFIDSLLEARSGTFPEVQLRHLARFITGTNPNKGRPEYWHDGTIPWISPRDVRSAVVTDSSIYISQLAVDDRSVRVLPEGSVLVVTRGTILAQSLPVAIAGRELAVSQEIKALLCGPAIRPKFLWAALVGQSKWLLSLMDASAYGMRMLSVEVLRNLTVACPPLDVQDRVISQIWQKIGSIDSLIAVSEQGVPLLAEKRDAVITSAVTRGVDVSAKMRRVDLAWPREIPAHWDMRKVRRFGRVGSGSTPARHKSEYWAEGIHPWLTSTVVNQESVTSAREYVTDAALRDYHLPLLSSGTVLIAAAGEGSTRGKAVVLSAEATINQNLIFIEPDPTLVDPWFLRWVLHAAYGHLRDISTDSGSLRGTLTLKNISDLQIPLPSRREQRTIVEFIVREAAVLDRIQENASRTVELLRERRTALLDAAVKGQFNEG